MSDDVETFVKLCLHRLSAEIEKVVPRPLGHAIHASKPNEIHHFDFCYIAPGEDGKFLVLVLKDYITGLLPKLIHC